MASENWRRLRKGQPRQTKDTQVRKKEDLWFEVDAIALKKSQTESLLASGKQIAVKDLFPVVPERHQTTPGKYVAMDCEFVGVGAAGVQHALARVSLVNFHGHILLDTYVRPRERIVDYRSHISGVKPEHLRDAPDFQDVQVQVAALLSDKIVIGHGLTNDFSVLMLSHPRKLIRDTSKLRKFRSLAKGKTPSLRRLSVEILGVSIQEGAHDSVDDARVAMLLYRSCKDEWENSLFRQEGKRIKAEKREKRKQRKVSSVDCCSDGFIKQIPNSGSLLINMK